MFAPHPSPSSASPSTHSKLEEVDYRRWRLMAIGMAFCSAVSLFGLAAMPGTADADSTTWLFGALACVLATVVAWAAPKRPSGVAVWAVSLLAVGAVAGLVAFSEHTAGFPFFLLLPVLSISYLRPLPESVVMNSLATVLLGVALVVRPDGFDLLLLLQVAMVTTFAAAFVRWLRDGRDQLVYDLKRLASTDSLTGLANRAAFEKAATRMVLRAQVDQTPLSLVTFDIDHFKRMNDTHGHAAGDDALRGFAATLKRQSRPTDLIARIGGEEFAAVMPGVNAAVAAAFAERVGEALRSKPGGPGGPLTVSAGVAPMGAKDTVDSLLKESDRALYAAKGAGRDRVVLAELVPFPGS